MQFPRRAALLLGAAIVFLLPVSSQPTSHAVRHIHTSHHPSWQEFFVNLLERTAIRKADGVPELENGEKPAQDPQNIDDKPGSQAKPSPSQQKNAPVGGGGSGQKPPQNEEDGIVPEPSAELVTDPKPPSASGPTITPEVPGVNGMTGPEAAITVNPSPPQGKPSVQPNSQELLGGSPSQGEPGGAASIGASASSPSSSSNPQSASISGKPSPKATKASTPTTSSSSSLPDTSPDATGSGSGKPASPSSNSGGGTQSDDISDNTDEPSVEDQAVASSAPTDPPQSPPPEVPGPTIAPSASKSTSLSPKPEVLEEDDVLASPEAGQGLSTMDSSDSNASLGNETTGNAAVTAIPPPGTTAVPPPGPDNPPSGSTTAPVASSTPNAVETAIVPPPSTTSDPLQPSQTLQPADVTAIPPPSETDGAAVPPTPASQPDVTAVVPPPQKSPSSATVPSSAPETPSGPPSGSDFTCLYFGDGSISGFEKPDPALLSGETSIYSVPPRIFPGLAPQYLSHIFGKSWSYDAWVDAGLTYDFILGFAEIYEVACNAGSTAAFRKFEVIIGSESTIIDIAAEVGCGKALKKTFTGVVAESNFITVSFQGFGQQAILNTMCYRPTIGIVPSPTPQSSSIPDSSTPTAENIVGPDENFKCINFGPKVVGGYTQYDKTAVQGNALIYSGSGSESDDLPAAYRYHVFGQDWGYALDVSSDRPQKVVLGFAEIYPKACDSGRQGAFRVFTTSVGSDLELVDVMKTSGCGVVEQVELENVAPQGGLINISLSSISGDSMLSVICFASADSLPPQSVPTAIPPPTSPSLSPAPPGPSTPDASTYDACFKFGDEIVDGFTNVKLGSGIESYTNPFAVVTGTPYDKVYGTHVFGTEFTFSVEADSLVTRKSFILGFAEVFQPACKEGYRVFDVSAGPDSKTIDVYKEVGCNSAFDVRFDGVEPSSVSGRFEISFSSENNFAMLSAVCILDESVSQTSAIVPSSVPVTTSGTTGNDGSIEPRLNAQVYPGTPNSSSGDELVAPGLSEETSDGSSPPEMTSPKPTQTSTSTNDGLASSPEGSTLEPSNGADPSTTDEPSSSTAPEKSEEAKPSPTASMSSKNSPLPEEDGVILSLPDVDTTPEPTEILIDVGLTSESNGSIPSPDPSIELVETDFSQTTLGVDEETQSPQASPTVTVTPEEPISIEKPPVVSPSASTEQTMTSNTIAVSPSTSASTGISPSPTEEMETSQGPLEEDSSDDTTSDADSQDEVMATFTPIVTAISPNDTQGGGSHDDSDSVSQVPQEENGLSGEPESSFFPDVNDGSNANAGELLESPLITFGPPDTSLKPSTESIPTAVVSSPDAPNNAVNGDSTESNQGVIIVVNSPIPSASPVEMIPSAVPLSPIPSAVPASPADLLPPVDNTPGPSVISTPSSVPQSLEPVPTGTPIPIATESPGPSGDEDSPVGVAPDSDATADDGQVTPSPSASLIISTTGTDEVITVTTEAPSPDPAESTAEIAPAGPVYDSPDNGTGNIEVTDGSGASDENVKPNANEVIVAGEFKELISPRSEGKGFTIGMGVLGALLVLLLLVCLFFAIFRSGGGAYSYSSQYSGRKPTDYGDPSQGGYTEELAPGSGDYGNTYSYGQGAQDGYAGGQGTFESRPQTNDESFAYEGAGDPLLVGSGYGSETVPGPVEEAEGSTYEQTDPDTFQDYTSLNMQQPTSEHSEAQVPQNEDYTFTDTFTIQNNGIYSAETRAREIAQMQKTQLTAAIASERSAQGLSQSSAMREDNPVTEGPEYAMGEYNAAEKDITEQDVENAQGSDTGDSPGNGLSINSNPETVASPYESNFVPQEDGTQSSKLDASRWKRGASARRSRWIRHRSESLREEHVTETEGNLLRTDYSDSGAGVSEAIGERWGNALAPASGVDESRVSNDGPWPAWWSRGKHLDPNLHADLAYEQEPAAPGGVEEKETDTFEDDGTKENGASSAQGDESTFQQRSEMFSQEENNTFRSPSRPAPLAASSRPNVMPVASHIVPDSGWRRGPSKKLATIDENTTLNLDFEELRRRREPYVKSVASRLSVGLHSISTSMSKESAIDGIGEEYEGSQHMEAPGTGTGTGATSWIGQTPVMI